MVLSKLKYLFCFAGCFFSFNQYRQVYHQKAVGTSLYGTLLAISKNINTDKTYGVKSILKNYNIFLNSRLSVLMQYRRKKQREGPMLPLSGNIQTTFT